MLEINKKQSDYIQKQVQNIFKNESEIISYIDEGAKFMKEPKSVLDQWLMKIEKEK